MLRAISCIFPAGLLALSACGFVHDEKLDGPYRLVAVDTMEDMTVCRAFDDSGNCEGVGFPEGTVFAAGANPHFVAVALHPRKWPDPPDRSKTRYYYLARGAEEGNGSMGAVQGPFDARQFGAEKHRLGLPAFSHVIDELK